MAAGAMQLSELPVTFAGHPHILTDLCPSTTCEDLISALLRFRQALSSPAQLQKTVHPNDCDFYVIRHGERRRKINRNVRIQTFYRHYAQRYSAAAFSFEVVPRDAYGPPLRRRASAQNVCSACTTPEEPVSSPDTAPDPAVAFFDPEAARRTKEEEETRRHLLKTIARQSQELERLRVQLGRVEEEIGAVEWKVLPSRHLPDCIAHYERLHRCNRRILAEHAKIELLTRQLAASRAERRPPGPPPGDCSTAPAPGPLRRTLSDSSLMDLTLDGLRVPPPKAFDDDGEGDADSPLAPPPPLPGRARTNYVNLDLATVCGRARPLRNGPAMLLPPPGPLHADLRQSGLHHSQPLDNGAVHYFLHPLHAVQQHRAPAMSSFAPTISIPSPSSLTWTGAELSSGGGAGGGVDSDTGLGSLSDEGGVCLSPAETLV